MKADEMRAMFERWKESGLSLHAFGKLEQVGYAKLLYWRRKFREENQKSRSAAFAPVRIVADDPEESPEPDSSSSISIWLCNGVALEVPCGVGDAELKRIVRVLASC